MPRIREIAPTGDMTPADNNPRDDQGMNVIDWLLDSDPSIRWQVMRDLTHEPARGRRRGAGSGRHGGLGRTAARPPGAGWAVGRAAVVPGLDGHLPRPRAAPAVRPRARQRAGPAGRRAGAGAGHLAGSRLRDALGGQPLLRRRGRAVHQRQHRRHGRVLRRRHDAARGAPARGAAGRRRLELRGRERRDGVLVRDDDQRARRRCSRTSGRSAAPSGSPRHADVARATCSSAACSDGSRPAR